MSIATTAETLRQLLQECPDTVVATLLGCSAWAVKTMRRVQKIPSHWAGQPLSVDLAAGRVSRRRWSDYPGQSPDPIALTELDALAKTELKRMRFTW